jgi:hypothetical protein
MTDTEYERRLRAVRYTCAVNQRYHQILEWRSGFADRTIRILVGVLAITGAIFAVPQLNYPWLGFWVAVASAIFATVLNIVPVGEWQKFHTQMFQRWSDLQRDATTEEFKTCEHEGNIPDHCVSRLQELLSEMESLHAMEPAPSIRLLNRCQEEENEREWGKGIRTSQQVEGERARLLEQYSASASA